MTEQTVSGEGRFCPLDGQQHVTSPWTSSSQWTNSPIYVNWIKQSWLFSTQSTAIVFFLLFAAAAATAALHTSATEHALYLVPAYLDRFQCLLFQEWDFSSLLGHKKRSNGRIVGLPFRASWCLRGGSDCIYYSKSVCFQYIQLCRFL